MELVKALVSNSNFHSVAILFVAILGILVYLHVWVLIPMAPLWGMFRYSGVPTTYVFIGTHWFFVPVEIYFK